MTVLDRVVRQSALRPAGPAVWDGLAAALAALYAVLVTVTLGGRSLWEDEGYSVAVARLPWSEAYQVLSRRELNGSLHTVLLSLLPAGSSELVLRLPSILAVALAAWLLYRLLLPYGGALAFTGEALFLSFTAVAEAAAMARSYGLLLLTVVALMLLVQRGALQRPGSALAYGVLAGLGLYLHFFLGLLVLAQLAGAVIAARSSERPPPQVGWVIAPLAVLGAPIAAFLLLAPTDTQVSWIAPPGVGNLAYAGLDLVASGGPLPVRLLKAALYLMALLAAVVFAWRDRGLRGELLRAGLVLFGLPALVLLVSFVKPLLTGRYLWLVLPALTVVLVLGLRAAVTRRQLALIAVPLGLATLLGLATGPAIYADYRGAVRTVAAMAGPGDMVLPLTTFRTAVVMHYAPEQSPATWLAPRPDDAEALLSTTGYDELTCLPPAVATSPSVYVVGQLPRVEAEQIADCSGRRLHEPSFEEDAYYGNAMFTRLDRR